MIVKFAKGFCTNCSKERYHEGYEMESLGETVWKCVHCEDDRCEPVIY